MRYSFECSLILGVFFCSPFGGPTLHAQQSTNEQIQQLTDQKNILQLQADIAALQKAAADSQNSSTTQSDLLTNQKTNLQLQSDIQSLQNGMVSNQISTLKTQIGSINTANLPQGNITLTNVDLQPTIVGYSGLRSAVDKVYKKLYPNCPQKVVLGSSQFADVAVYQTYMTLLDQASDALVPYVDAPDFTKANAGFAPAIAFAAIDAALSIGQLFKSDVTIAGNSLTPDGQAAQLILAHEALETCKATVPKIVVLNLANVVGFVANKSDLIDRLGSVNNDLVSAINASTAVQANSIVSLQQTITDTQKKLTTFDDLEASKQKAQKALATATVSEAAKLKKQIVDLETQESALNQPQAVKDLADAKSKLTKANAFVAQVAVLNTRITTLTAVLNKIDDAGIPFMVRLLHAEQMKSLIGTDSVLTLNVIKLGGNSIIKKNAFRTTVSFAGGAIVDYELRGSDGVTVEAAGQEDSFEFHREKDVLGSPK